MSTGQLVAAILVALATVGLALAAAYVSRFDTRTPIDLDRHPHTFTQTERL